MATVFGVGAVVVASMVRGRCSAMRGDGLGKAEVGSSVALNRAFLMVWYVHEAATVQWFRPSVTAQMEVFRNSNVSSKLGSGRGSVQT